MNIVHLVPSLDPCDGVGNYATLLAKALYSHTGILNRIIVARSGDRNSGFPVMVLASRTPEAVAAALSGDCDRGDVLIAHLSHYGFATRGTPFWLVRGIERWINRRPAVRLIVMFHELYAFGPPWRSSFWLLPVQKWITRRFLEICDSAVTTTERYETALLNWRPNVALRRLPIFSLVGEPAFVSPPTDRANVAVVFGRAGVEDWLYDRRASDLAELVTKLNIQRIIDIGPRSRPVPAMIGHVAVEVRGVLPADGISNILQDARYGLIAYPSDFLGKSSTFAAYAAHGVLPILLWRNTRGNPGQEPLFLGDEGLRSFSPEQSLVFQARLRDWYASHSITTQSKIWEDLIVSLGIK
jgi:hypothetical protein